MKHSLAGSDLYLLQWYYYSYIITQNNTVVSVTLKFEGYVKSPDGFGTGTYEVLHPKGASIEITRSLFEGDVLQITSVRNTPDLALEKARGIRLYDGNKKLFDGYLRAPDYRRGSSKYRMLTTGVYDWRKKLEAIYIMESAGGTESYVDRSIDLHACRPL